MPTSHLYQINEIMEMVTLLNPKKVLDIGVGFGKYGMLTREYLEFWDERFEYRKWNRQIDGIEAFEEYLTPLHDFIYNKMYKGNALDILPKLKGEYDLILLIDVLEHFTRKDGERLLKLCMSASRNIIISTPKDIGTQGDVFDNEYETHRYEWKKADIEEVLPKNNKYYIENIHSLLCLIGEEANIVENKRKHIKREIREKNYPITSYPRRIKKKLMG